MSSNSKLHLFGPAAFFFWDKSTALRTAHARVTHDTPRAQTWMIMYTPNLSLRTGNPELWQAVPFSKISMSKKHLRFENVSKNGGYLWYLVQNNTSKIKPGISSYPLPPKHNIERTPRAILCTDRAQPSTTAVSGRPSSVDLLSVCANGARTKRFERKSTKNSQYTYA